MKYFIALLVLAKVLNKISASKLPVSPEAEEFSGKDSLNTRDIPGYGSYAPYSYGSSNLLTNLFSNFGGFFPSYSTSVFPQTQYTQNADTHLQDNNLYYNQQTWNPSSYLDWNSTHSTQQPAADSSDDYSNSNGSGSFGYGTDWMPNEGTQPSVMKKITTVINDGKKEIKHKVYVSPDHPDATGYISIKEPGNNGNDSDTVYYNF